MLAWPRGPRGAHKGALLGDGSRRRLAPSFAPMSPPGGGVSDSDADLEYLEEYDASRGVPFSTHLLAGSGAGLAEHCLVFPLDTIKTNAQCVGACGRTQAPDVVCVRAAKQLLADGYSSGAGALRLRVARRPRVRKAFPRARPRPRARGRPRNFCPGAHGTPSQVARRGRGDDRVRPGARGVFREL